MEDSADVVLEEPGLIDVAIVTMAYALSSETSHVTPGSP